MSEQKRSFHDVIMPKFGIIFLALAIMMAAFACEKKQVKDDSIVSDTSLAQSQSPEVIQPQGSEAVKVENPTEGNNLKKESETQKNLPRLVSLGADQCIPCKMMAPIRDEIRQEYDGKLVVEYIDVWKSPETGKQYKINVIPTLIFYDTDGKEFKRHIGYIPKVAILDAFRQKGIKIDG